MPFISYLLINVNEAVISYTTFTQETLIEFESSYLNRVTITEL